MVVIVQLGLAFIVSWTTVGICQSSVAFRLFTLKKRHYLLTHAGMITLLGRLPDYHWSVKCFIAVEITLVSSFLMILTLEKETKSLGAPRVACTSHTDGA